MKNSLRMIGISIILWLGLGIGLANAATLILTSNSSGTDATLEKNTPESMIGMDGASGTSGSGLAATDVSFVAVEFPDSANTALAAEITANPSSFSNVSESSPTGIASLQAPGPISKISNHASDAKNSTLVSEHQTVAMLLVGLGLLGFSARHRRDVV